MTQTKEQQKSYFTALALYLNVLQKNSAQQISTTGNVTSVSALMSGAAASYSYAYDGMGRLLSEASPYVNQSYTYDLFGNRATDSVSGYVYDSNNRLTSQTVGSDILSYNYDPNGNLFSKTKASLTSGGAEELELSQTSADSGLYDFDGFNRLVGVQSGSSVIEYVYNGDGQRVAKLVDGVRTDYVWDGMYIVYEATEDVETVYKRGLRLFASETGGVKSYYNYNAHGDVVQVLSSSYAVIKEYAYDAFGVEQNIDENDTNPFRYCAEYFDTDTGLIHLRARFYDPGIGRFISEDPIRDGNNWYVYCSGDPVNRIDPSGLDSIIFVSKGMEEQADVRKGYYTDLYGTASWKVVVSTADMFVKKWNEMIELFADSGINIDAIEIISHGSADGELGINPQDGAAYATGYLYFADDAKERVYARWVEGMKSENRTIGYLKPANAKALNINACNSANPDIYNIVWSFMKSASDFNAITGWDGGTRWDATAGDHVRGGGDYIENPPAYAFGDNYYYVKKHQYTWWKYVKKNSDGSPVRERIGRRYFY